MNFNISQMVHFVSTLAKQNPLWVIERFSYDLEMKLNENARTKQTTNEWKWSDLIGLSNGYKSAWLLVG